MRILWVTLWIKCGKYFWCFIVVFSGTTLLYFHGSWFSKSSDKSLKYGKPMLWREMVKPGLQFYKNESYDVILSAYMNSGSRFTGRLLGFRADSFYFYEPLLKFSTWDYYKPPNVRCSSTEGNCRNITIDELNTHLPFGESQKTEEIIPGLPKSAQPMDLMLYALSSIFTCQLEKVKNLVQSRVHGLSAFSGPSWKSFRQCSKKFKSKTECLQELGKVCRNKTTRISKVIRMTVGALQPLLEANPHLKIIHLVRDPRAIIHSRIFTRGYPVYGFRENDSLERALCDKMLQDIEDFLNLREKFPRRLIILYYEDLLLNLHVRLKYLYKQLRMAYNRSEIDQFAVIQVNLLPPEKPSYKFNADRQTDNAFWWRKHMTWYEVEKVNNACSKVMEVLGYRWIENEYLLRDTNYTTLRIPKHFQF